VESDAIWVKMAFSVGRLLFSNNDYTVVMVSNERVELIVLSGVDNQQNFMSNDDSICCLSKPDSMKHGHAPDDDLDNENAPSNLKLRQ